MGQSQSGESRSTQESFNQVYNNDDRNNNMSMSCLKSPDQVQTARKHRVTFDPSSRNRDEDKILSSNTPQRTLSIQTRERLIDSGGKSPAASASSVLTRATGKPPISTKAVNKSSSKPTRDLSEYRRSLRLALSSDGQAAKKEKDFTKTNGFLEELVEQSVDDPPLRSPRRAVGSYTSTYQVNDDENRCSSTSDKSFWSSDYSTSVGGNSEKSNDSSEQAQMNPNEQPNHLKLKPENFEQFLTKCSKGNPHANESLQERLRQRLSIFQHLVPEARTTPTDINSLSENILLGIFSYLPTKYLCIASGVCKKWHMLCWDPQLWRSMKISKYSGSNIDKVLYTILFRLARSTQGLCLTLQYIRIVQCECLSDRGLSYIAKYCIDLEKLEILACPCIMNRGVQNVLENCLRLSWLDVRGCSCINSICQSMITNIQSSNDTCFRLTYLDISDCVAVDDLGLRMLGFTCKRLETLHMRRCPRVTDVGMQHLAGHCTSLRELSISDCHKVRDFSLKEISRYCPSLRYLSLMRCAVTDAGIKMIAKGCSNLRYLNVRSCTGVTDAGVVYVAQNCLKLRSLDVGKCEITNNTLSALGIHCPQLKRLSIKGCRNLTDVGIRAVVAQCCLLHYLNVEDCSITLDTYEFIREHCQSCVIEHTTLDI
ncbi:F-box/LRR-repeat protein 7-like [Dendronephthya gigantea]|uniref:F-box/LRR-repeat protein 7-like n=1 Tax=Dendronephthya gigantea TaxID=151771 RepID=UPI001069A5E8|nr:F-box/LRR-repeat protein 7-like [Dendronephthya gigantea]